MTPRDELTPRGDGLVSSRASLLTPAGRGAVAVIAAAGPAALATIGAHFHAANRLRLSAQPINRIAFGHWVDASARPGADSANHREEVVVCRTAEAELEIHCHGGVAAAQRILAALAAGGCNIEPWAEWLSAHAADPLQAEAETALAAAATRSTAAILLDQRHGALRLEVEAAQADLAANDPAQVATANKRIARLLDRAALGLHLTRPWHVAIAGRPNVGKSSLINALVGYQRAIVYDQPGTTRDVLAAETAIDGWPVRLTDAAGLRTATEELEAAGVELAKQALTRADLVVWVLDASTLSPADQADPTAAARRELAAEMAGALGDIEPIVVANKSDLAPFAPPPGVIATSALTGAGLDELLSAIAHRLPAAPESGTAVPFTSRQVAWLQAAREHITRGDPSSATDALARLCDGAPAPARVILRSAEESCLELAQARPFGQSFGGPQDRHSG